jgi:hypothetical protein
VVLGFLIVKVMGVSIPSVGSITGSISDFELVMVSVSSLGDGLLVKPPKSRLEFVVMVTDFVTVIGRCLIVIVDVELLIMISFSTVTVE